MKSKTSSKIMLLMSIAIIAFLFALSPIALVTSATSAGVAPVASVNPSASLTATSPSGNLVNKVRFPAFPGTPQKGASEYTFATNIDSGTVDVLNSAGKLVTKIGDGGSSGYGVTYAPSTKKIYVFDYDDSLVFVINPTTMKVVTSFTCHGCIFGVYVPSNGMIYASQFDKGEVIPFNPKTYAFGSEIQVCSQHPEYIAYNGGDGNVYVPARSGCYSIIDPNTNVATNVSLGTDPNGVACSSSNRLGTDCWITDESTGYVYEVNGSTLVATITNCDACYWGDAFNPTSRSVYVTSTDDVIVVVKGSAVVTNITTPSKSDADCLGAAKTIVVPLESGYAIGINKENDIMWTTNLKINFPESCTRS
jgi:YVTN family beta-propeller protein